MNTICTRALLGTPACSYLHKKEMSELAPINEGKAFVLLIGSEWRPLPVFVHLLQDGR